MPQQAHDVVETIRNAENESDVVRVTTTEGHVAEGLVSQIERSEESVSCDVHPRPDEGGTGFDDLPYEDRGVVFVSCLKKGYNRWSAEVSIHIRVFEATDGYDESDNEELGEVETIEVVG